MGSLRMRTGLGRKPGCGRGAGELAVAVESTQMAHGRPRRARPIIRRERCVDQHSPASHLMMQSELLPSAWAVELPS